MDPYYAARHAARTGEEPADEAIAADDQALAQPVGYDPYYEARQAAAATTLIEGDAEPEYEYASYGSPADYEAEEGDCDGPDANGCGPGPGAYDQGDYFNGEGDGYCDPAAFAAGQPGYFGEPRKVLNASPGQGALWYDVKSCRRFWINFDYLNFWAKGNHVPALATTSAPGTPQVNAGVLGLPTTTVLFGDERVNTGFRPGGRLQLGVWLAEGEFLGLDGHYYALGQTSTNFTANASFNPLEPGAQILARPFFNTSIGAQDSLVVAFPNFIAGGLPTDLNGGISIHSESKIQSASFGLRHLLSIDFLNDSRLFITGGYRFFKVDETLNIANQINPVGGIFLPGTFFRTIDQFSTSNQFNGGYVGLLHDKRWGRFSLTTNAQLALGDMHEVVQIDGSQVIFDGVTTTFRNTGLLTNFSNIGKHTKDQFTLIPEIELKLGYQLKPGLRATIGYNFTYVTRLSRPGNEVDLVVNPTQVEGVPANPSRPAYLNNPTDLWLQGGTAGLEVRF